MNRCSYSSRRAPRQNQRPRSHRHRPPKVQTFPSGMMGANRPQTPIRQELQGGGNQCWRGSWMNRRSYSSRRAPRQNQRPRSHRHRPPKVQTFPSGMMGANRPQTPIRQELQGGGNQCWRGSWMNRRSYPRRRAPRQNHSPSRRRHRPPANPKQGSNSHRDMYCHCPKQP